MDPQRGGYPEEPTWFGGDQYPDQDWDPRLGEEDPRVAEQRGSRYTEQRSPAVPPPGAAPTSGGWGRGGPVGPRSGEPMPPIPGGPGGYPHDPLTSTHEHPAGMIAPPMPPPAGPPPPSAPPAGGGAVRRQVPASDGVYRARRPATAVLIGLFAGVLALPLLRLLIGSVGTPPSPGGVVAGVLALAGLPLAALGMYGLITGAARVPDTPPARAWSRPPLAYLLIALVLFVAAGLAAS